MELSRSTPLDSPISPALTPPLAAPRAATLAPQSAAAAVGPAGGMTGPARGAPAPTLDPDTLPDSGAGRRGRPGMPDWLYGLLVLAGGAYALIHYGAAMDDYEKGILIGSVPVFALLGWVWKPLRLLLISVTVLSLTGINLYAGTLDTAQTAFLLKYFLSSQSAILWMSALFLLATVCYWIGILGAAPTASWMGSLFTWAAVTMGLTGLMVRWHESYLISPDVGHIPVSNLYEVFVLFALITALFMLYYERRYRTRQLGPFVLVVISAAVGFLLWYTFDRGAHEIQPLVPALQSWWMKIHVPANFIGYGTFSLAAMVAYASLLQQERDTPWSGAGLVRLLPLALFGLALGLVPLAFRSNVTLNASVLGQAAVAALVSFGLVAARRRIAAALPPAVVLDDIMYRAIAVGFAFFTIATILGAFWAAEAWGSYWSWDPKETWALIVWLNYAAWLHMRLMKGLRGVMAAWWALIGLVITCFAFLGVNMFLSGLHSYGTL